MPKRLCLLLLLSVSLAAQKKAPTQTSPGTIDNRLPVRRVVLYKNGVGYFEHSTRIRGTQDLNIDFTSAQLNDVLKSLTVVDLGEGRISSVRYNSIAPLSERLKGLRLPFGEQITRDDFLSALRGARVEVRSGTSSASGKLLSVEKIKKQVGKDETAEVTQFAVVTDTGEMRSFDLGPSTSVRLAERDLNEEVGRYLNLVGSSRARDVRRMTITATGNGEREVFVSYISEVPVWKSTYRIILPEKGKPILQGWAIVDNTIGEDWKDVHLSLVAGAPQSFVQEISQPFYTRRPVVALPESAQLTPQTHEAAVMDLFQMSAGVAGGTSHVTTSLEGTVTDMTGAAVAGARVTVRNEETGVSQVAISDRQGRYRFTDLQAGNTALFVQAPGFQRFDLTNFYLGVGRNNEVHARLNVGSNTNTVEVRAEAVSVDTSTSSLVATKSGVEAEGKSAGDFFEYVIKQLITIGKNQSALVPILQATVEVEKVTLLSTESPPLRALWLKNTSGQILDSGTFNILDGDNFAGEGVVGTIHPDEKRLLSYAGDPAIHVKTQSDESERPYTRAKVVKGILTLTKSQYRSVRYAIRNADQSSRQVIVEHPAEEGWKLTSQTAKPEETTANFHRFRLPVEPGRTSELLIEEIKPEEETHQLTELDNDDVRLLSEQKRITPAMQQAFDRILAQKQKIGGFDLRINDRNQEATQINADQNRLRENMKALKGSAEEKALIQRYTGQLNQQEDRLAALRKETADLKTQRDAAQQELEKMVMEINLDENF